MYLPLKNSKINPQILKYLIFIKEVAFSDYLPLNVLRETSQFYKIIKVISNKLAKVIREKEEGDDEENKENNDEKKEGEKYTKQDNEDNDTNLENDNKSDNNDED